MMVNSPLFKMAKPTLATMFLHDWAAMENASQLQTQYCDSIAYGSEFPATRQDLQRVLERVYRKGFCAGANAIVAYDD
jgi:hypothetical protein